MLPDQVTQLLTAFVDGELGQRQRKAVMRLLHRSSEARELLRQLQENAHRIKQLPRRKVEPSLVDEIVQAIAAEKMQPKQPARPRIARRAWKPYVAASLAASLLIGAIGLGYWKSIGNQDSANPDIAKVAPEKKPEPRPTPEPEPIPTPRKAPNPMLRVVDDTFAGFSMPIPEQKVFAASFGELKNEGRKSAQLTYELGRDKTVQLDVTVKNNSLAMERLKAALYAQGIKTAVDPDAAKSLKKQSQGKVEYLVYADNVTTEELAKILKELSLPDTTGMGKSVPTPFEKLKVAPVPKDEKKKVNDMLKIDLNNQPKNAEPGPAPKRWDRVAVVLPVNAKARPAQEIRQFGDTRPRPQAGAVQVLIKIHQE